MKKIVFFIIAIFAITNIFAQKEYSYEINGSFIDYETFNNKEKKSRKYVYLIGINDVGNEYIADSSQVDKLGKFHFLGKIKEVTYFYLSADGCEYDIFVDAADSKIVVDFSCSDKPDIVKGSSTQLVYDEFKATLNPIIERIETAYANNNDEMILQIQIEFENKITELVKKYNKSIVSAYYISNYISIDKYSTYFNILDTTKSNVFLEWMRRTYQHHLYISELMKKVEIGKTLPEISLPDMNGKEIPLSSLRGQYVLIDVWASWCRPCIGEMPYLQSAYEKYKEKGFNIYAISIDENKNSWQTAIKKHQISWVNVSDLKGWDSPINEIIPFSIGIPFNLLINPEGVIIAQKLRGAKLEKKLQEIFIGQ